MGLPSNQTSEHLNSFDQELASAFLNENFHLILLPTEQCNFRCNYCYEDFSIGRMNSEVVQSVKQLIDRRLPGLRSLSVSWFGGEPLLARSVVEDISEYILGAVRDRPRLRYTSDMTTNGYLLDTPTVERLTGLGIGMFQVSLDGPELLHDRTRLRADGKGSFRRIWRNLLDIRKGTADVNVLLRIHLTPDNLPFMEPFLTEIRKTFLSDERFKVLLKAVEHLGGPNDSTIQILPKGERPRVLAELEGILRIREEGIDPMFSAPHVCYASRPNSLMIRANGLIGKCTVALSEPANTIGRLLPDGSLRINNTLLRQWLHGWESRDWKDLGCPYANMPHNEPQVLQIRKPVILSRSTNAASD
jgi:uncharacterized protein